MTPLPGGQSTFEATGAFTVRTAQGAPVSARAPRALVSYLRLARPADTTFAFVGTVLGAALAGLGAQHLATIAFLASSNALLSAASMMFNDWRDVEADRINRPARPIPSGAISARGAVTAAGLLFALGVAAAFAAGGRFGTAALFVVFASVMYTLGLKSVPFVGNVVTASLSSYPLWCWTLATGGVTAPLGGAALGFFLGGAGREIVRTAGDSAGDRAMGIRTVATTFGESATNRIGLALIFLGLAAAQIAVWGIPAWTYRASLGVATALFLIAAARTLSDTPGPASHRITRLARFSTGLLAFGVACDLLAGAWRLP